MQGGADSFCHHIIYLIFIETGKNKFKGVGPLDDFVFPGEDNLLIDYNWILVAGKMIEVRLEVSGSPGQFCGGQRPTGHYYCEFSERRCL